MRERILLFTILTCLGVFLYVFQNHVNTAVGFLLLCACMVTYGLYSIAATKYQKRKLKKHPIVINENYKPLVFSESFYLATKGGGKFFGKVGSFEEGYDFDAIVLNDNVLSHPQTLNLAERMERAVYLGLDEKNLTAKFVAGTKVL